MKRIDADAFVPITNSHSASVNGFGGGDPTVPTNPTEVDETWLNNVQEEIMTILDAASVAPNGANFAQLLVSLRLLFVDFVSNQAAIGGNKTFTGNVAVGGSLTADNGPVLLDSTTVDGTLAVNSDAHVIGNDHVNGNEQIDGTLTVNGTASIGIAAPTTIASMPGGFLNSWADGHALSSGAVPGAWKDAQGMKHIRGEISHSGAGSGTPVKAFTLDTPFHPAAGFSVWANNAAGSFGTNALALIEVDANGDVFVTYSSGAGSANIFLECIQPYL